MLLLPRELWDQVSIDCLKNDVMAIFKDGYQMGTSFDELTKAHKYNEDSKNYCIRQFISNHFSAIVYKCHEEDFCHQWNVPWVVDTRHSLQLIDNMKKYFDTKVLI